MRRGHPWVFRGEIAVLPKWYEPGGIVDVADAYGTHLGRGYYNPHSQICVRLLTRDRENIDAAFFDRRLAAALARRERLYPGAEAVRLVFSEGDRLPGLIVDRYEDCLAVQFLTLGMDLRREMILDSLIARLAPRAIQERSAVRAAEGLAPRVGALYGEVPDEILVREGNLVHLVNLRGGQKTGHFLDQRENRLAAAAYAAGRRVLDCFCHTGGFGLAAAAAGAESVHGVDIDADALSLAERNAALNGLSERCRFERAEAFDFLRRAVEEGRRYDLIVLDPPAFTKSRLRVDQALRGYKEINLRGIRLLEAGGILVTCSCSHHVSHEVFLDTVRAAAADAGREMRLLERRGQPADHPVLLAVPETEYLKCLILEVIS